MGDSNTQRGYPNILQQQLGEGWEAVNCGKGGATVLNGTRTPYFSTSQYQKFKASAPNIVVIMLGTNDANPLWWEGERKSDFEGSAKDEFIFQFKKLIAEARELSSQPKVYVVTPPPIFPERSKDDKKGMRAARQKVFLGEVLPLVKEIAKAEGAPLIDVHTGLLGDAETCTDGLHFNKKGYTKLAMIIKEQIAAE